MKYLKLWASMGYVYMIMFICVIFRADDELERFMTEYHPLTWDEWPE